MAAFHIATFRAEVTPPLGHPLCGGWIEAVRGVDDPLEAVGVVLLGAGKPVVLCVLDWTGLRNEAHWRFRDAIAEAAHTTPECVAVHCVHPHDAPFADVEAQRLIAKANAPISLDLAFFDRAVNSVSDAVRKAIPDAKRWSQVGFGKAKVHEIASNRRILGPDGKLKLTRTSSAGKTAAMRDAPEGLIDPWLRTLSFWDGDTPRAALTYYATHPMSYYGQGRVSADFCGHARRKRQEATGVFHAYFNGCAGNVTAGKYNDGSPEQRVAMRDRLADAMKVAWSATQRFTVDTFTWKAEPVRLPVRDDGSFAEAASRQVLEDAKATAAKRNNAALQLAWRARRERPIEITFLDFGAAAVLHLPGEPFVEYQLFAQSLRPDVCVAGYGDGGPGYIPTAAAYLEGGYEPTVALAAPESEAMLRATIRKLMAR
ncbi:MAG: hypothetical protein U0746_20810 [Gemmataceae bacterium]